MVWGLKFPENAVIGPMVRSEVQESSKVKSSCCSVGEEHPPYVLFGKLTNFSSFVRMLVAGFEKEIIPLLRKMEARRGCGVNASGGRGSQT